MARKRQLETILQDRVTLLGTIQMCILLSDLRAPPHWHFISLPLKYILKYDGLLDFSQSRKMIVIIYIGC